jgi:adenylylsulfate kinase
MKYYLYIGRFQPFHKGHEAFVKKFLDAGKPICVAIRDTKMSKDNPHTYKERKKMVRKAFGGNNLLKIITIPDIEGVVYGRKVGYGVHEIRLDPGIEAISATNIRNKKK